MEHATPPSRVDVDDRELAEALPAALERASLLEWRLEQVTLREKDLWLRLEAERTAVADAQQRIADLTGRVQEVEDALAEARRANAALTARLAEAEDRVGQQSPRAERDAVALARAWRREQKRADHQTVALREARDRLEVLEHAQVRFHTRLTQWQRQVATAPQDLDLAEFIAELRAEVLRLGQVNAQLRSQLSDAPPAPSEEATTLPAPSVIDDGPGLNDGLPSVGVAPMVERLMSPDPEIRRRAATILSQNNSAEARSAILSALPLAANTEEQVHLLSQLARAGGPDQDDALMPYVQHTNPTVRATALDAVSAVSCLQQGAQDPDPYVRRRALIRWTQLAPNSVGSGLTRAVHDPDPGVRRTACAALAGHSTSTSTVTALLYAVDDPDPAVRTAAVRSLPPELRNRLSAAVVADPGLRRAALNVIRMERRTRASLESSSHAR